jgi:hypothetical protein
LRSSEGALLKTPLTVAVKVVTSDEVAAGACSDTAFDRSTPMGSSDKTSRSILEASDGRRWTLYLRIPDMPADRIRLGDTFDLALDASEDNTAFFTTLNQTVTLAKAGRLVLFVSTLNRRTFTVPNLSSFGIDVKKEAATCESPADFTGCGRRGYSTYVAIGGQGRTIDRGLTGRIGDLSWSVEAAEDVVDSGRCDGKGFVQMAGVDNDVAEPPNL